jgi:hypothetical protein
MSSPLQNKLLHYEVPPPEGAWDKIAVSLDENISLTLSEKLFQYEEVPSSKVWQKINAQLNNEVYDQVKVVPLFIKYRRPLKYSGAVAVFIFLAVLTSLLISKKTESELPAQGVAKTVKKDTSEPNTEVNQNSSIAQSKEINKTDRLIAKSKVQRAKSKDDHNSYSIAEDLLPHQAYRNEVVSSSVPSDKYMIYSDGDGNAVRLPKKIFSAFACPTEDIKCKQRLQQLREKFAESAMTADFTGLLQILKSLQENQ